jgi:hypothetical protein
MVIGESRIRVSRKGAGKPLAGFRKQLPPRTLIPINNPDRSWCSFFYLDGRHPSGAKLK